MDLEELAGRTDRQQREIEALGSRMTAVETNHTVSEVLMKGVDTRLQKIEGNLAWIIRLIIGAIIAALLGLVITSGGGPV